MLSIKLKNYKTSNNQKLRSKNNLFKLNNPKHCNLFTYINTKKVKNKTETLKNSRNGIFNDCRTFVAAGGSRTIRLSFEYTIINSCAVEILLVALVPSFPVKKIALESEK